MGNAHAAKSTRSVNNVNDDDTAHKIDRFFAAHLAWVENYMPGHGAPAIDWAAFMQGLEECPQVAFRKSGMSWFPPLHYVLLARDVPIEVVQKLLEINGDAVFQREDYHAWNIFQWLQWDDHVTIPVDVLRLLLEKAPNLVMEEKMEENKTPLEFFFDGEHYDGRLTEQFKVILECCPHAVAWTLAFYFMRSPAPPCEGALKYALDIAEKLEKEGNGIYDEVFQTEDLDEDTEPLCLLKTMYDNLDSAKRELFHCYLKAFVKGRLAFIKEKGDTSGHLPIDVSSLSNCVLFLLAKVENIYMPVEDEDSYYDSDDDDNDSQVYNRKEMWCKYLEIFRDDITKRTTEGDAPLFSAIRLCHQWSPVIETIWKEDPSVLETADTELGLPPFLVAATKNLSPVTIGGYYSVDGMYFTWNNTAQDNNTVNTTYALLRANPNMIRFRTRAESAESAEGDRKRAASTDIKPTKGHKKRI